MEYFLLRNTCGDSHVILTIEDAVSIFYGECDVVNLGICLFAVVCRTAHQSNYTSCEVP